MTQQPSSELSPTAKGALIGGGIGSAAGLLSTLFKKDRSVLDAVKRTLIGGGVGAAVGAGSGGLARSDTPTPPPASAPSKPKLSGRSAALAGLFPIVGPAIYGATQSEDGHRLGNALKLGGSSWAGALPGGIAAKLTASKHPELYLPAMLLAMSGSSYGTRLMTNHINKHAASRDSVIEELARGSDEKLSPTLSAILGLIFPVAGPAVQGLVGSGTGQRWDNAASLAGASALGTIGTPIGSSITSFMKARKINDRNDKLQQLLQSSRDSFFGQKKSGSFDLGAIGNQMRQGAGGLLDGVGNLQIRPLDPMGGAAAGGLGGAAIGGLGGLLKAIFDREDDGVMGTLRKTLGGAALGGATGAAMGGGYSALRRNQLLSQVPEKHYGKMREIMSHYTAPLKSEVARITGGNPARYAGDINRINARASVSHMMAPALVRRLEQRAATSQRV